MKRYAPLLIFAVLALLLAVGLTLNPKEVPSVLIGKPAADFRLDRLDQAGQLSLADMKGKVWLLNVWASWCSACVEEHAALQEWVADPGNAPVVGMAYKDADDDSRAWLKQRGNPYKAVIADRDGRVGIDYGVYGVPETFVIDAAGRIVYKHIGPLTPAVLQEKILPAIRGAK